MDLHERYDAAVAQWRSKNTTSVPALKQALESFCVPFAYHSGVIENPNISYQNTREIFESHAVSNYTGTLNTLLEMQNQRVCHEYLLPLIAERRPIRPRLVRKVHELLVFGTYGALLAEEDEHPGEYKKNEFRVGNDVGVDAEDVAEEMQILCDDLDSYEGPDYLRAAAFFHLQFESIHPFADGNGRVGRSLLNYYLMTHNLPPFIIFREDRQEYYQALYDYDNKNTLDTFVEFAMRETVKTWEK